MEREVFSIKLHLGNGGHIPLTYISDDGSITADDLASALAATVSAQGKPHWLQIENVVVFTGAVSAIEVLD